MEYLVSRNGQHHGPYSEEAIRQLRAEGRILDTDLCWTDGMPGWQLVVNALDHADHSADSETEQEQEPAPAQAPAAPAGPLAPMPPSLHWALVLALSFLTLGIFGWAWMFLQAAWVRRFDPRSRAVPLLVVGLLAAFVGGMVSGALGPTDKETAALAELFGTLAAGLFLIMAAFKMRDSIEHHFRHVEPMTVSINPVLTFFFTFIYLQYHLTRIAQAKRAGMIR